MDVRNTKEALVAAIVVGKFMIKLAKDGLDWSDGMAVIAKLSDDEFRDIIAKAVEGYDLIDDEMKDMNFDEAMQLVQDLYT